LEINVLGIEIEHKRVELEVEEVGEVVRGQGDQARERW